MSGPRCGAECRILHGVFFDSFVYFCVFLAPEAVVGDGLCPWSGRCRLGLVRAGIGPVGGVTAVAGSSLGAIAFGSCMLSWSSAEVGAHVNL